MAMVLPLSYSGAMVPRVCRYLVAPIIFFSLPGARRFTGEGIGLLLTFELPGNFKKEASWFTILSQFQSQG